MQWIQSTVSSTSTASFTNLMAKITSLLSTIFQFSSTFLSTVIDYPFSLFRFLLLTVGYHLARTGFPPNLTSPNIKALQKRSLGHYCAHYGLIIVLVKLKPRPNSWKLSFNL